MSGKQLVLSPVHLAKIHPLTCLAFSMPGHDPPPGEASAVRRNTCARPPVHCVKVETVESERLKTKNVLLVREMAMAAIT